jgi:transcriptional regulator with XRE-family HTH domain
VPKHETPRILKDFGRRVAELRKARGWRQVDLAQAMGCSPNYVQDVERGEENLTILSLADLAGVLGVEPEALLDEPQSSEPRRPGRPRKR